MHRMFAILGILGVSTAVSAAAPALTEQQPASPVLFGGQGPVTFKDPDNAALLYYKTWLEPVWTDLSKVCGDKYQGADPNWKPDADLIKLLEDNQGVVRMLIRASQAPEADFGIEFSQGINALLPHLNNMRASARILGCDARRCMVAGDVDGACERIAAIYRTAYHCTNDRVLISALVSIAITSLADTQTQIIIDTNRLSTAGKQMLLTEARLLAQPDGWSVKRSMEGERWWTTGWMRTIATGPSAGQKIVDQLLPLMDAPANGDLAKQLARMDEAEVSKMLDDAARFYDDVLKVWNSQDAQQKLRNLEEAIGRGDYGLIAQFVVPALGKCYQSDTKARAEHDAVLKKLEYFIPIGR